MSDSNRRRERKLVVRVGGLGFCRPTQPDDDPGICAMARPAARHRDARRERFSRDAGDGTPEWFAGQNRATRAHPVVLVGYPTWPFMHLEHIPSHLAARTSRYVSRDTYLRLLVPFSPAHQTARQVTTESPVEQGSRLGKSSVRVSTQRRTCAPGGANEVQCGSCQTTARTDSSQKLAWCGAAGFALTPNGELRKGGRTW